MSRSLSHAAIGIGVGVLGGLLLVPACATCPDLRYKAFEFEVIGADPSHVRMTVTNQETGAQPCQDIALSENCNAGAGTYDLAFVVSGAAIPGLTGVCTLGELSDCAAEDAEQRGPWPLIKVDNTSGSWVVTEERKGTCP